MAYSNEIRHKAMELRKQGYSLKEISRQFGVVKSTASLWSRDVVLNKKAEERLLTVISED
jgi:transposase-like protein